MTLGMLPSTFWYSVMMPSSNKYGVDQAILGVEKPLPEQGVDDRRYRPGHQQQSAQNAAAGKLLIEQEGDQQRKQDDEHNRHKGEGEGGAERRPKVRVGKPVDVIFQADESLAARAFQIPIVQAEEDGDTEGRQDGGGDDQDGGRAE